MTTTSRREFLKIATAGAAEMNQTEKAKRFAKLHVKGSPLLLYNEDPSHIGGQIVHSYAVERAAALSNIAHVNRDGLQPSGSEHARQVVKITRTAAGIRQQQDRDARTIKGAFQCRVTDFDVSMLLQSYGVCP